MTRDQFEKILDATGIKPVKRFSVLGEEVFIADGFVPPSMQTYLSRFNIEKDEFPYGCFMTFWVAEQKGGMGDAGFAAFDAFHDSGHSPEAKLDMRVQEVERRATADLENRKKNATKH